MIGPSGSPGYKTTSAAHFADDVKKQSALTANALDTLSTETQLMKEQMAANRQLLLNAKKDLQNDANIILAIMVVVFVGVLIARHYYEF